MSHFTLDIATDNAAFDPEPSHEVARILRATAERIDKAIDYHGTVRDVNGNTVGGWEFTPDDDADDDEDGDA